MSSLAHQLLGLKDKLSMGSHTLMSDANAFCERLMEALLDRNRPFEESICGREVAHVIWSVFVSAAKSGVSMEEFSAEVAKAFGEGGTKAQEELAKAMCSAYEVGGTHPSWGIENARDLAETRTGSTRGDAIDWVGVSESGRSELVYPQRCRVQR